MAAKLPIITDVSALDATQVKLCHFFKCTYDFKQCYWTGNGYDMYMRHMKNKHGDAKYFCYMCEAPEKKNKIMMEREELFDHIVYNHGFRVFQCNLCLYRAARITHVEIHHCTNHPENYDAAVENKKDFVGVPSAVVICERTVCGPHPNEEVFFLHYRSLRVNKQLKFPHYQCLYCEFVAVEQLDVFQHIAESHRDFPLCLYDPTDNIEVLDGVETNGDSSIFSLSANPEMVRDADETIKAVAQDDLVMSGDEEQTNSALEEEPPMSGSVQELLAEASNSRVRVSRVTNSQKRPRTPKKKSAVFVEPSIEENDATEKIDEPVAKRGRDREKEMISEPVAPYMPSKTGALNRCTVCEITFPAVKKLNHLRDYHLATQSIKCSRCDFINSVAEVNKHIREEHSDALTSIICFIVDANQNGATILRKVQPMVDLRQKAPSGTVGSKPSHPKAPAPGKAVAPLLEKLNSSIVVDAGPRNWKERPLSANQAAALRQSQHDANWKPMTTTITEIKCPKVNKASVKRLPKIQADDERRRYFDFENVDRMKAVSEEFFCIVDNCTETFLFADIEKGIRHLKQHLSYGMHCRKCNMLDASALFSNEDYDDKASRLALREHYSKMHPSIDPLKMWDDDNHRPDIGNWIGIFFNRQFKYAREQNKHPPLKSDSPKNPLVYITCPLCEKASKILNADENLGMVPRKFSNMIEFENHYWTHTSYYKRQCKICLKRFADDKAKALDHASRSHRDVFANYNYEDFFPVVRDLCLDKIIEDSIERKKMEFYQALMQSYGVTADFNLYVCIAGKERDLANKGLDGPVDLSVLDANLDPIRVEPLPSTSVEFDSPEPEVAELLDQDEEVLLLPPVKAPTPTIFDVSSDDDEGEKNIPPASLDDKKSLDLEAALARLHGDL